MIRECYVTADLPIVDFYRPLISAFRERICSVTNGGLSPQLNRDIYFYVRAKRINIQRQSLSRAHASCNCFRCRLAINIQLLYVVIEMWRRQETVAKKKMRCTVADKQNIQLSMVLISASLSPAAARRLMIFNCEWEKALGELRLLGATYSPAETNGQWRNHRGSPNTALFI